MTKTPKSEQSDVRVPSTIEMDGLYTQQDIDNRHYLMAYCRPCKTWQKLDMRIGNYICAGCGSKDYDRRESRSIRSWEVTKDLKKERKTRARA